MVMFPQGPLRQGRPQDARCADLDFVADAARKINDKGSETYGICLRGKARVGREHGLS